MSIEALVERLCVAVEANTVAVETLNAGRAEALAKLNEQAGAGEAPKATRRSTKKADETPAAATDPVVAADPAPARTKRQVDISDDGLRTLLGGFLGNVKDGSITEDEQKRRGGLLAGAVNQHFGSPAATGPKSTLDDEQRYQLTYFVERWKAGLDVNFAQDYDFDGDPLFDKAAGADLLG